MLGPLAFKRGETTPFLFAAPGSVAPHEDGPGSRPPAFPHSLIRTQVGGHGCPYSSCAQPPRVPASCTTGLSPRWNPATGLWDTIKCCLMALNFGLLHRNINRSVGALPEKSNPSDAGNASQCVPTRGTAAQLARPHSTQRAQTAAGTGARRGGSG